MGNILSLIKRPIAISCSCWKLCWCPDKPKVHRVTDDIHPSFLSVTSYSYSQHVGLQLILKQHLCSTASLSGTPQGQNSKVAFTACRCSVSFGQSCATHLSSESLTLYSEAVTSGYCSSESAAVTVSERSETLRRWNLSSIKATFLLLSAHWERVCEREKKNLAMCILPQGSWWVRLLLAWPWSSKVITD